MKKVLVYLEPRRFFMYICPRCSSTNTKTERRPDGFTECLDCGYVELSSKFPHEDKKVEDDSEQ